MESVWVFAGGDYTGLEVFGGIEGLAQGVFGGCEEIFLDLNQREDNKLEFCFESGRFIERRLELKN